METTKQEVNIEKMAHIKMTDEKGNVLHEREIKKEEVDLFLLMLKSVEFNENGDWTFKKIEPPKINISDMDMPDIPEIGTDN